MHDKKNARVIQSANKKGFGHNRHSSVPSDIDNINGINKSSLYSFPANVKMKIIINCELCRAIFLWGGQYFEVMCSRCIRNWWHMAISGCRITGVLRVLRLAFRLPLIDSREESHKYNF